jgi:c-di-GMP-binding flagellar brake protein YcgR
MQTVPPRPTTRRRYSRVPSLGECFAQLGNGWEGSVLDLSLGGMLLRVKRVLTLGSSYFVKLLIRQQTMVVEARVVRVQSSAGDYLTGMEFVKLSSEDREALRGFTESKTKKKS